MGNGHGSPAARRQLGLLLKQLRENAGKSIQDVREAKIAGDTKVWRLESGKTLPSIPDVLGLCWLYGADRATTDRLTGMVGEVATGGGWWEDHGDAVPSWLSLYVGMEQTASDLQIYEPDLIHGLLQTRAYALAANDPGADAERNAELRLARQRAVFDRSDPFRMRVVLGAGALARQVGGAEAMDEQTQHLRELVRRRPTLEIRVLAWDVGFHAAINGPFARFEFASPGEDPVVYVPLLAGGRYVEKPEQIAPYTQALSSVWGQSTPIEEYTP